MTKVEQVARRVTDSGLLTALSRVAMVAAPLLGMPVATWLVSDVMAQGRRVESARHRPRRRHGWHHAAGGAIRPAIGLRVLDVVITLLDALLGVPADDVKPVLPACAPGHIAAWAWRRPPAAAGCLRTACAASQDGRTTAAVVVFDPGETT